MFVVIIIFQIKRTMLHRNNKESVETSTATANVFHREEVDGKRIIRL